VAMYDALVATPKFNVENHTVSIKSLKDRLKSIGSLKDEILQKDEMVLHNRIVFDSERTPDESEGNPPSMYDILVNLRKENEANVARHETTNARTLGASVIVLPVVAALISAMPFVSQHLGILVAAMVAHVFSMALSVFFYFWVGYRKSYPKKVEAPVDGSIGDLGNYEQQRKYFGHEKLFYTRLHNAMHNTERLKWGFKVENEIKALVKIAAGRYAARWLIQVVAGLYAFVGVLYAIALASYFCNWHKQFNPERYFCVVCFLLCR